MTQRKAPAWMGWVGMALVALFLVLMMFPGGFR